MLKKLALFCALIGMVAIAGSAYAEVQNIRVSGDIEALAVYRSNYDLENDRVIDVDGGDYTADDTDSFLMSIIRLQVDADLTDNVAACVRLANIRDWDTDDHLGDGTAAAAAAGSATADTSSIILDLAYITLKEMLYSPLTLVIGRQELGFGNGLIVGNGLYQDPNNSIKYNDLSPLHGYDAVQAILDYEPLAISLVLAKMQESDDVAGSGRDSDTDLYGVNAAYIFDSYDAEAEAYLFYKRDENYALSVGEMFGSPAYDRTFEDNKVYTAGLRGSLVPLENLTVGGELALQWGEISDQHAGTSGLPLTIDREGLAVNASAAYALPDVKFAPLLGLEYLYVSGEEASPTGDFEAWDPMYRGKVMGSIRDYLENLYETNDGADTSGLTNQHTIKATGSVDLGELVDGLSLDLAYLYYWFDEVPFAGADDEIGDEINVALVYDYTEDVQFGLEGAWFMPGEYYGKTAHTTNTFVGGGIATATDSPTTRTANDTAVSVVGSCKVSF